MFKLFKNTSSDSEFTFHVQTFNILSLCSDDYIVEPASVKFLVEHGFDFNRQYSEGLSYHRGNDKVTKDDVPSSEDFVRQTFMEIIRHKKPIVLHNGFIDLVFMYQNLYAQLPTTVHTFAADLAEMFPNGIYDTKYISDYVCRKEATFLEYVFRSQQRKNIVRANNGKLPFVQLEFNNTSSSTFGSYVHYRPCDHETLFVPFNSDLKLCPSFSNHGHCSEGKQCPMSHDIDQIVLSKDANTKKNDRKRKKPGDSGVESMDELSQLTDKQKAALNILTTNHEVQMGSKVQANGGSHRAGYDAFMTGFSFATYLVHSVIMPSDKDSESGSAQSSNYQNPKSRLLNVPTTPEITDLNIMNRIYLVCKDIPFIVRKSAFSRNSVDHANKYTAMLESSSLR